MDLKLDDLFRDSMSHLASGVAVVTTRRPDGEPCGIAATSVIYLLLAYPVIYIRELRHFLPLAIVVLPLAVRELERRADHLSDSSTSATATNTNTNG